MLDKLKNLYKAIKERKLWPIIAIIAFLSSVFLFYWIDYISPKAMDFVLADSDMHNIKAQYVIGEICSGDVIEQQIPVDVDIYGIGLDFATYNRINSCTVSIEIYDENDICLFTKDLSAEKLEDNAFYDFIFDEKIRPIDTDFIRVIITSPDGEYWVSQINLEAMLFLSVIIIKAFRLRSSYPVSPFTEKLWGTDLPTVIRLSPAREKPVTWHPV